MAFRNSIASRLPEFRGDNTQNISTWLKQFEAHCTMQEIRNTRKLPALLCCLEDTAFTEVSQWITDGDGTTYEEIIVELERKFSGAYYRRKLQVKLQSLVYTKEKNINTFSNELLSIIKSLYSLQNMEVVRHIALNHIMSNLDDSLRSEAKIFQLTGNDSLENLLEFLGTKMSINALRVETNAAAYNSSNTSDNPRIDKLESMMEKILEKLNNNEKSYTSGRENVCGYCAKKGHSDIHSNPFFLINGRLLYFHLKNPGENGRSIFKIGRKIGRYLNV